MRLYAIRHGEAENKDLSIYQRVSTPHIDLTKDGRLQIEEVSKKLSFFIHPNQHNPVFIFTSPYRRTQKSAEIISHVLKHNCIKQSFLLIERNFGQACGCINIEEYVREMGEERTFFRMGSEFYRPPRGESKADVAIRAEIFLTKLLLLPENCDIITVSHQLFLETMHKVIEDRESEKWENAEIRQYNKIPTGWSFCKRI